MKSSLVLPVDAPSPAQALRLRGWASRRDAALLALIGGSLLLRLLFAGWYNLGVDESYMVAAGRQWQWGYYDHPPMAWWLAWGAAHLFGSDAARVVRLPFIGLFALSTWLMARLGERLFSRPAGLLAALLFNLVPVLGFTTASWVLPDGPMDAALLGFALAFVHALKAGGRAALRWWLLAGLCAGLALLAKYSAVLVIGGAGLYLLSTPQHQPWLRRPEPWLGFAVAVLCFVPVLVWNAENHWISFAFQGGRAHGASLHWLAPFATLGGEALFIAPWIWLPLVGVWLSAARRGPADRPSWLLFCLGTPMIAIFSLVALWSRGQVLFHWAAPGYMLLLPLLGAAAARSLARGEARVRWWLAGAAGVLLFAVALVGAQLRFDVWSGFPALFRPGHNPEVLMLDWHSLRPQLADLGIANPLFGVSGWVDAGKLDYALEGSAPVICLGDDPHEYGLVHPASQAVGRDVVILERNARLGDVRDQYGDRFERIDPLPPLILRQHDRVVAVIPLFLGHHLRQAS